MSVSRRLLATALVATAAFGLAACGPNDSSDQGAGTTTATTAPAGAGAASPTAAPAGGGTAKPAPSGKPTDGAPEGFCTSGPLPAGHKWIDVQKGTTATALVYKETKDVCGVDDVGHEAVGPDKTAQFAPTVKGHLRSVVAAPKDVNAADLAKHINECVANPDNQKGFYPCSSGDYEVALDASGKVTEMWERPSS
ncbi:MULTISPECIES: hypothetical protein [Kitasatospora]|uniref:Lipoprotein n=1 Tax=Kitasatospora cathayae TaxID=3004092 RepID=A0ABY7Q4U7_9ACTN|nr:hypothetical protein [Kitasatospora sp. HUAS 3-15]WBP87748.1 hypothetical protein O1G21_19115 [Kitasatospora sp. HUAS 3-15]